MLQTNLDEIGKISKFQVFNIEGYIAGDSRYEKMILDALGLEKIEDLPRDRYEGLLAMLNAMTDRKC